MNFRRKKPARSQGLEMTALMDVIFLLLCFFVTTSVFSQWESEIAITLPSAKSATNSVWTTCSTHQETSPQQNSHG